METHRISIKPLSAAAEDNLIDFRLSHPDTLSKQVNRHLYLLDTSYLPADLQSAAAAENDKRSESLELDVTRYTLALKRARKATDAQRAQQEAYKAQTSVLERKCEERREEIQVERAQLDFAKKKKQMHEECEALAKQLKSRPRKKAELDKLIGELENQIKEQEELIAAYQTESSARLGRFDQVLTAMDKMTEVEKVEPGRSVADMPTLDKVLAITPLTATHGRSTGSDSGKALDPKASVFTPVGRPILPGSTNSAPNVTKSSAVTSRPGAPSRGKDKNGGGSGGSATTINTGGINRTVPALMTRTKSSASTGSKKAALGGNTRSRTPVTNGSSSKDTHAPRAGGGGGRRQATNTPSQLKTSTINMEDGEISGNEGAAAGSPAPQKAGGTGGGPVENAAAGGNKRNRQDQEDGDAVKRRRVEESKKDGVVGV
ncbi:hypothetical protein QFC19_006283 [Naganishia cerealis]|uniref:Uncharacterized protein n=1 Tax=Naganishia cerealis TaxID=610337 RepID=A0ACC2VJ13_9TREE|nr:hypothetical protein QFC19_006283 [Naganishia cerealis]